MDDTILGECDVEYMKKENLLNLYSLVIKEVAKRGLTKEFDKITGF